MKFLTTTETAEKWGVSASLVLKLAKSGRIPGTKQIGTRWMIPCSAEKPEDGRHRKGSVKKADSFRFPGYEYRTLSSFSPPLNEEELVIKSATEAVYACRFADAYRILGDIADTTADRYIRINALYTGCMIDIYCCNISRFLEYHGRLAAELREDFPHKAEMMEFLYSIEATLGDDIYYGHEFQILPVYEYHESFLPRLANLSAVSLIVPDERRSASELKAHELNCIFLKDSEAYADLLALHLYLGVAYSEMGEIEKQNYHLKKALSIAEKHESYYIPVMYYYNMEKLLSPVLLEFPESFRTRIENLSQSMSKMFNRFISSMPLCSIYSMLDHGDYIFLYYAVIGLSNKEVAHRFHISAGAVGKRYGEIYSLLGVKNKAEMIKLYKQIQKEEKTKHNKKR